MAVSKWVKGIWNSTDNRGSKPESLMVTECLIAELEYQMREIELVNSEQSEETRRRKTGVDYSWLVSKSTMKSYQIPQMERLELEELCFKVKPNECGAIIEEFRRSLEMKPTVSELPRLLRGAIIEQINERPAPETMTDWVKRTASMVSLRHKNRKKISPQVEELDQVEMQSSETNSETSAQLPIFTVQNEITYSKVYEIEQETKAVF